MLITPHNSHSSRHPRNGINLYFRWCSARQATEHFNCTAQTLRRWEKEGRIQTKRHTVTGQRCYLIGEGEATEVIVPTGISEERECVIYARVSSLKQKKAGDLDRQIQLLKKEFPDAKVVSEVASGINFRRKQLTTLLERVCRSEIHTIVCRSRDRLARFAFPLIENICKHHGMNL